MTLKSIKAQSFIFIYLIITDFVELVNSLDKALKFLVENQELDDEEIEQQLKKELVSYC